MPLTILYKERDKIFGQEEKMTNHSHSPELIRMVTIWPDLNEGMRSNLLALAALSLLRHGKVTTGFAALGSGLRLRAAMFLRGTRDDLVLVGGHISGFFRNEKESLA